MTTSRIQESIFTGKMLAKMRYGDAGLWVKTLLCGRRHGPEHWAWNPRGRARVRRVNDHGNSPVVITGIPHLGGGADGANVVRDGDATTG